ncbi:MAG: hypothetical protein F6K56_24855 [Moorea sp. SIO3G5]|nr:hypothetical protein [Moorena sp. SIO3G5]
MKIRKRSRQFVGCDRIHGKPQTLATTEILEKALNWGKENHPESNLHHQITLKLFTLNLP